MIITFDFLGNRAEIMRLDSIRYAEGNWKGYEYLDCWTQLKYKKKKTNKK